LHALEKHIDAHLLPYLLINHSAKKRSFWKALLLWSCVWALLTLGLAGPRWSYREMDTFSQDQSLVVLLDLSESMNATDVKPSRLIRAKQKIEDLLNLSKGVKIGLIAFAADSHMMAPLTDDKETIRHLMSSLDTELVYVQGSRLTPALEMAATMLDAEPGDNKALLVISDGGFEDSSAIITAKNLAARGVVINSMGIGTVEGAQLSHGKMAAKGKGSLIYTKLEAERLKEISHVGNGRYLDGHFSDREVAMVLEDLLKKAETQLKLGKKNQFWDEHFYLMILPVLPIVLWWFRRGSIFAIILLVSVSLELHGDYFKNQDELGKQAFDEGNYESAINSFQDPYRKGVAYYKAENFAEAEKMFSQSTRADVDTQAAYNLGNAQAQQQKYKEAISTYEKVLKTCPEHIKAKENLELLKKLLDQQKQNDSQSDDSDQQDDSKENNSEDKERNKDSKGSKDKNESQENQKENDPENNENQQDSEEKGESQKDENEQSDEQQEMEQAEADQNENQEAKAMKSQEDQDADQWLNRIENDPKTYLKNKFYIESKRNGTKEGIDPW